MDITDDMNYSPTSFRNELEEENNFLLKLVDTIPAKIYFDHEIQEKLANDKHATLDSKLKSLKGNQEFSIKNRHKRARLDPSLQKTVSQIQNELGVQKEKGFSKKKGKELTSSSLTRAANIEELQGRLHEHIQELKQKRKGLGRDYANKKKLSNKLKKMKKKKAAQVKIKVPEVKKLKDNNSKEDKAPSQKVYNKEGKMIYGKLDFSENGIDNVRKKSEFSGKKYKTLLKKAEEKKEKFENLKKINPEKAQNVEEKEKWKKAILKSENVKVKDDPVLLKKAIKRREKKKKHSAKQWKERNEHKEASKARRQEKRTKNLNTRKEEKKKNKIKKARKKGRMVLEG